MNHVSNAKICEIIFSDETFLTFFQDPAFYDFPSPSSPGFLSRFPAFPNELDDGFRGNSFEDQPNHSRHAAEPAHPTESIPIRVFHERTSTPPKNRLNAASSRNTTEIPARTESPSSNIQSEKSPRLERAHSEPPKMQGFSRLRPTSAASPAAHSQAYSTIPENSESNVSGPRYQGRAESEALTPNHKLSSSASAPSVPSSNQTRPSPVPPPRRNKLEREEEKSGKEQVAPQQQQPPPPPPQQQQQPSSDAPKVRHIPIFVEGRDDPVVNRKTSGGDSAAGFRQPSEFYPPNVQKVRSQSVSSPGTGSGGGFGRGLNLKPHPHQQFSQEPTSPLSPPPSDQPIPMGCSEHFVHPTDVKKPEPTSPAPPPPGPIPMPFCPDSVDSPAAAQVHNVPVRVVEAPEPPPPPPPPPPAKPEPKPEASKNISPAEARLRKIESEVEEILERVEKFNGCKKDREYLFLDDLLTQKLCLLDGIESEGREDIRKMRKDSIKSINRCLSILDRRATPKAAASGDEKCDDNDAADVANKFLSVLAKVDDEEEKNSTTTDDAPPKK